MDPGQRAASVKFLITDRAGQFTESFDAVFAADGTRILPSPPQASRADAAGEPMIGTVRRELFDRLLIVNEGHLRQVLTEYLLHYNTARPHRSLGQLEARVTEFLGRDRYARAASTSSLDEASTSCGATAIPAGQVPECHWSPRWRRTACR